MYLRAGISLLVLVPLLMVAWLLALVAGWSLGGPIHLLLVLAIVLLPLGAALLVIRFIRRQSKR